VVGPKRGRKAEVVCARRVRTPIVAFETIRVDTSRRIGPVNFSQLQSQVSQQRDEYTAAHCKRKMMHEASLGRNQERASEWPEVGDFDGWLCKAANQTRGIAVHSSAVRNSVLALEPGKILEAVQDFGV
jgi:hypothetical protein